MRDGYLQVGQANLIVGTFFGTITFSTLVDPGAIIIHPYVQVAFVFFMISITMSLTIVSIAGDVSLFWIDVKRNTLMVMVLIVNATNMGGAMSLFFGIIQLGFLVAGVIGVLFIIFIEIFFLRYWMIHGKNLEEACNEYRGEVKAKC